MAIRTDLALEQTQMIGVCDGVTSENINFGRIEIDRVSVKNNSAAEKLGKPIGDYVTISFDKFLPEDTSGDLHAAIKTELLAMLPKKHDNLVLVAGLGNRQITPDALGPKTAAKVFVTRHIKGTLANEIGLRGIMPVAAVSPGVLGDTGIEASELILAAVEKLHPDAVIVIDALAARDISRLGSTVQITNAGINPGAGVGNCRPEISENTLGVPTVALGVPTVVDVSTFVENYDGKEYTETLGKSMMVTPRDIDEMIVNASQVLSHAINVALQPNIESEVLISL